VWRSSEDSFRSWIFVTCACQVCLLRTFGVPWYNLFVLVLRPPLKSGIAETNFLNLRSRPSTIRVPRIPGSWISPCFFGLSLSSCFASGTPEPPGGTPPLGTLLRYSLLLIIRGPFSPEKIDFWTSGVSESTPWKSFYSRKVLVVLTGCFLGAPVLLCVAAPFQGTDFDFPSLWSPGPFQGFLDSVSGILSVTPFPKMDAICGDPFLVPSLFLRGFI